MFPLPVRWLVILQKFSPDMLSGIEAGDDGIEDARRAVHDVERRMKAMVADLAGGNWRGVFIRNPTCVHAVHVNTVGMVIGCGGARHHVERCLGHIGVGMSSRLGLPVELAFDGGDIDDVLVAFWRAKHQRFEARVKDERGDGIDEMHFEEFDGWDFRKC